MCNDMPLEYRGEKTLVQCGGREHPPSFDRSPFCSKSCSGDGRCRTVVVSVSAVHWRPRYNDIRLSLGAAQKESNGKCYNDWVWAHVISPGSFTCPQC